MIILYKKYSVRRTDHFKVPYDILHHEFENLYICLSTVL